MSDAHNPIPDPPDNTQAPRPRSGGPRTPEGKERSRRNALKHGLRARVLTPDELIDDVQTRTVAFTEQFQPRTSYDEWLVGQLALATVQLDRCAALAIVDQERARDRAEHCWESDRRLEAENLGARLAKDPARVARALPRTRQGAGWLIERWQGLGNVLRAAGDWNVDQRRLAFDLLGIPPELRPSMLAKVPRGDQSALATLVEQQVERLRAAQAEDLDDLDEVERALAIRGVPVVEDAVTARLRRYEAGCRRSLRWARAELQRRSVGASRVGEAHLPEPVAPSPMADPSPIPAVIVPAPPPVGAAPPELDINKNENVNNFIEISLLEPRAAGVVPTASRLPSWPASDGRPSKSRRPDWRTIQKMRKAARASR